MGIGQIENSVKDFERSVDLAHSNKKRAAKNFLNNAGIVIGVFILFVVVLIMTTDLRLAKWADISNLLIDFLLLLLCSYSMYINCSDSGMRLGLRNDDYLSAIDRFEDKKERIKVAKYHTRLYEFCRHYIAKELENTKMDILMIMGFDYETYLSKWLTLTPKEVNALYGLTQNQKKAIIKANAIEPIELTPEMILKRGRKGGKRDPLGMDPVTKKKITFSIKFVTTVITTAFMTAIVVDFVLEPTWIMFVSCMLRLMIVVLNGFSGYKFGYENIVYDTANYMNDQTDLMEQALQYFEEVDTKAESAV